MLAQFEDDNDKDNFKKKKREKKFHDNGSHSWRWAAYLITFHNPINNTLIGVIFSTCLYICVYFPPWWTF